jgi:hypothetical protein
LRYLAEDAMRSTDALMLKSALISRAGRFVAGDLVKMAEE